MPDSSQKHTVNTSVLIAGAGPVGLLLAHYLGRAGVATLVLEREAELSDEPRAVSIDAETLRSFQALDLLEPLENEILYGLTGDYLNGAGETLFELVDSGPGLLGYPNINGFNQPNLVSKLANSLERYPGVQLLFEHTLEEFTQHEAGVSIRASDQRAAPLRIEADFLVACDGGRSTVRAQLGIAMQGESNPLPWLVIDTREKNYDGKSRYRFYCDPQRPGMFIQTPHCNRRWEWMLMPGEQREQLLEDATIHQIIAPYVNVDEIDIYRRRVYDFHAIIAENFQQGRVFLAGDAAHMTPPFAGQGLNSGFRDVANLGWKLAAVINAGAPCALLESYQSERWEHARELIDMAVTLGGEIQPIDQDKAAARDAGFAAMKSQPEAMERFISGLFAPLANRRFSAGAAVDIASDALSGQMMIQPQVADRSGELSLLDTHLGEGFSILGYNCDPAQELSERVLEFWRKRGTRLVSVFAPGSRPGGDALVDEANLLARVFPPQQAGMVLLRPDRFCMAHFDARTAADKLARAAALLDAGHSAATT